MLTLRRPTLPASLVRGTEAHRRGTGPDQIRPRMHKSHTYHNPKRWNTTIERAGTKPEYVGAVTFLPVPGPRGRGWQDQG